MKTTRRSTYWALLAAVVLISACKGQNQVAAPPGLPGGGSCEGASCSNPGTPSGSPTPIPSPGSSPVSAVPTPTPLTYGATAQLNIVSNAVLNTYVGSTMNNPSGVQINIQVSPRTSSPQVFLGQIRIRFNDGRPDGSLVYHEGYFENGSDPTHGNNVNVLTVESGTMIPTYRLFAEDRLGVIVVTLQPTADPTKLSGKVWFRNFSTTANPLYGYIDPNTGYYWPPNPYAYCWAGVITTGPVDCRNMSVQPSTSGQYAMTLLGTITSIDKNVALGL